MTVAKTSRRTLSGGNVRLITDCPIVTRPEPADFRLTSYHAERRGFGPRMVYWRITRICVLFYRLALNAKNEDHCDFDWCHVRFSATPGGSVKHVVLVGLDPATV